MTRDVTTYWDYIKVEELLGLQTGLGDDEGTLSNDEVMFIVVHQIDELWFKLTLRELASVRALFAQEHVREQSLSSAVRGIRRAALLFEQTAGHFALMETMTTRDYLAFRDKLSPASGFQSAQMREIEILLGLPENERMALGHETYMQALRDPDGGETAASLRVQARQRDTPTVRAAIEEWLYRTPIDGFTPDSEGDAEAVAAFIDSYLEAHRRELAGIQARAVASALTEADRTRLGERYERELASARAWLEGRDVSAAHDDSEGTIERTRARRSRIRAALVFIESYRELPLLAWPREVLDAIVALEQAFTIFRQRHARMVERVIGRRTGTGGSAGVDYLDRTALTYRVFRDIWATRTVLLRESALPPLVHADYYGFAGSGA
ncbi:tryptophan 2,3-dioxygenase family protein [Haliangium ochraceum]|uniref:Tryptophan 2,3-dioxygenase n=1 Tax=Haliangium ochraceum (strain DSM 14365 / JCM 11303 / SMP-2) TaxID=502025 RepID=D0LHK4_HALO1|nr:tryptophan 2,3-dioxygenase family protein [Haliangium ochraceum]ACY12866.1 Tryptophan 2,3-dioxygenase [Haliangium ochraceum DSM 14365]